MAYQKSKSGVIRRLSDGAQIPPDPNNRDYKDFLAWEAAGNTAPNAAEGPSAGEITARQARKDAAANKLKAALGVSDLKGLFELIQDGG